MIARLQYFGIFILSLPAMYWGYTILSALPHRFKDTGPEDYIGAALGLILAAVAIYGLVSGRPIAQLPRVLRITICITAAVSSLFAIGFLLLVLVAISWR
jgi:hypothetical protein